MSTNESNIVPQKHVGTGIRGSELSVQILYILSFLVQISSSDYRQVRAMPSQQPAATTIPTPTTNQLQTPSNFQVRAQHYARSPVPVRYSISLEQLFETRRSSYDTCIYSRRLSIFVHSFHLLPSLKHSSSLQRRNLYQTIREQHRSHRLRSITSFNHTSNRSLAPWYVHVCRNGVDVYSPASSVTIIRTGGRRSTHTDFISLDRPEHRVIAHIAFESFFSHCHIASK